MDAKEWLRSRIANSSNEVKNAWDSMPTLFDALAEKCEAYAAAQTVELQQQVEALTKERDKLQYKYEAASDLFVASESKVERLTCELAEHSKAGSQLADGVISYKQRAERAEAEVMRLKGAAQAAIVPLGALIHSGTCDSGQLTSSLSEAIRTAHDLLLAALSAEQGKGSTPQLCANCHKPYADHLHHDGNKCSLESVTGWFPQQIADALTKAQAQPGEGDR